MTKNSGGAAKIQEGILRLLDDTSSGRRSIRWLAERAGIPYSTLQQKISRRPGKLTTDDLVKIADALGVDLGDLYGAELAVAS